MIPVNELRIGNWYQNHSNDLSLKYQQIDFFETAHYVAVYCNPIPLTEEWLIKFGFKRQNNAYNGPHKNDFSIWSPIKSNRFDLNDTINNVPKIEFVHQLQNLYFALTGQELIKK